MQLRLVFAFAMFYDSCTMKQAVFGRSEKKLQQTTVIFSPQTPHKNSNRRSIPPPIIRPTEKRKLIAFGWYGGKFSHLDWLLPFLPTCHHYCEPFAGSAAVLLNRFPSPIDTYNDLDGEVVNFFRTLRNQKDRLVEVIGLTPFSREEFALACTLDLMLEPLERAR